ncbi:MAG: hypothetical protein R2710_17250 [Acidimicrobiales bacterium]
MIVPVGASAAFLADLPITTLEQPELTDVFQRLGLDTLGLFAALSPADVVGRFGRDGQRAHRLARGEDEHPPDLRKPAADLAVTWSSSHRQSGLTRVRSPPRHWPTNSTPT